MYRTKRKKLVFADYEIIKSEDDDDNKDSKRIKSNI